MVKTKVIDGMRFYKVDLVRDAKSAETLKRWIKTCDPGIRVRIQHDRPHNLYEVYSSNKGILRKYTLRIHDQEFYDDDPFHPSTWKSIKTRKRSKRR